MVNLVLAQKPLMHGLMKMAGIRPYTVEIEPGTVMSFWVPSETITKPKKKDEKPELVAKPSKPTLVLVHGFAAEGIVTWQFQVGALTKRYSVYVPDLLFFGGSTTDRSDRSPTFQAECLAAGLKKLGVEKCVVVGFSYGGMVAFKMAEMYPEMVQAMVISGSILAMTDSISVTTLQELGFSSSSELLLPDSVKGLKALLSVAAYKKLWFPDRLHKDFLEEKMYQWILRQQQEGTRVTTGDIVAQLQNELELGAEESPMSPRQPFHQQNFQNAVHTNFGASIPSNAFAATVVGQGMRSGQPDQQAKNSVFSNALSSPIRRSLQPYHLAQGSCPSSNIMSSGNGTRNSEMTYSSGQNRDTNSSNSSDCMDMHADSPGHDFSY